MISFLKWNILSLNDKFVEILTTSWVWYEISINERIYANLLNKKDAEIFIHHHITENSQSLFWFIEKDEKEAFKELIKISWIWGKVAMNIISLWLDKLFQAISNEDQKTIEWINWIGKKWASKIILEMKDKDIVKNAQISWTNTNSRPINKDVLDALIWMGYWSDNVTEILSNLPEELTQMEDIIPYAIKQLSK